MVFSPQVLEVVRNNYDTLTLKLYDNLDQFERYTEKPIETAFFTPLVCTAFLYLLTYFCVDNFFIICFQWSLKEKIIYLECKNKTIGCFRLETSMFLRDIACVLLH